jgi:hypothetical protein
MANEYLNPDDSTKREAMTDLAQRLEMAKIEGNSSYKAKEYVKAAS